MYTGTHVQKCLKFHLNKCCQSRIPLIAPVEQQWQSILAQQCTASKLRLTSQSSPVESRFCAASTRTVKQQPGPMQLDCNICVPLDPLPSRHSTEKHEPNAIPLNLERTQRPTVNFLARVISPSLPAIVLLKQTYLLLASRIYAQNCTSPTRSVVEPAEGKESRASCLDVI